MSSSSSTLYSLSWMIFIYVKIPYPQLQTRTYAQKLQPTLRVNHTINEGHSDNKCTGTFVFYKYTEQDYGCSLVP